MLGEIPEGTCAMRWRKSCTIASIRPCWRCTLPIAANLEHSDWRVRFQAVQILGKLEPAALIVHAPARRRARGFRTGSARCGGEDPEQAHADRAGGDAPAIVAQLEHSDWRVRVQVVQMLGKLKPAVLAIAPAIAAKLGHSDWRVRFQACRFWASSNRPR